MERPKGSSSIEIDEDVESVVKAAGWAWYERGLSSSSTSGSEPAGKFMQEVSSRRIHPSPRPPQPSRFKLEAIDKMIQLPEEDKQQVQEQNSKSCNSSVLQLLDAYEIERISKHLESFLIITTTRSGSGGEEVANSSSSRRAKRQITGIGSSPSPTTTGSAAPATTNIMEDIRRRDDDNNNNKKKKSKGWFGLIRHNGRICGVIEENSMVKTVLVVHQHRRKPEKHVSR